jgi:hypothetical protein
MMILFGLAGISCAQQPTGSAQAPQASEPAAAAVEAPAKTVLVLDDFEGEIAAGPQGTIDAGTGNGSSLVASGDKEIKQSGERSLRLEYDAVAGGYMWAARGYGLDVKTAAQWLKAPEDIKWEDYGAISFYMFGSGTGAQMAFDIKDAGKEMFRFMVKDDFTGWKLIVCPLDQFFPRGDWQPQDANANATLDFPVRSFQFEIIAVAKGTLHIDRVALEPLN